MKLNNYWVRAIILIQLNYLYSYNRNQFYFSLETITSDNLIMALNYVYFITYLNENIEESN